MPTYPSHRQVNAEELERLYVLIGRGVWHLQYVEDALNTLITIKHEVKTPGRIPEAEARALLAKHRGNTLGTSLKVVKSEGLVPLELLDALGRFKEERDWLVHRSQTTHGDLLYTDRGRSETFARLDAFTDEATRLQKALLREINQYVSALGLDVAAAERIALKNIGHLRGEAQSNVRPP